MILWAFAGFQLGSFWGLDLPQTTRIGRGIVSGRVALSLRSAEIKPFQSSRSSRWRSVGRACVHPRQSGRIGCDPRPTTMPKPARTHQVSAACTGGKCRRTGVAENLSCYTFSARNLNLSSALSLTDKRHQKRRLQPSKHL